jgi:hypothetical protein
LMGDEGEGCGLEVDEDGLVGYGMHEGVAAGAVGHDDEDDVGIVVFGLFWCGVWLCYGCTVLGVPVDHANESCTESSV